MEREKQMSLILQALKRAKDRTGRKAGSPPPTALASFRFGRPTRWQKVRRVALFYLLPALALTLIIGYGVNFRANRLKKPGTAVVVQAPVTLPNPVATPSPEAPAPEVEVKVEPTTPTAQTPAPPQPEPRRVPRLARRETSPATPRAPLPDAAVGNAPAPPPPAENESARTQPAPAPPAQPQQPAAEITPSSRHPFELALFYQRSGDFLKASEQYKKVLDKDPLNASVYNNMGLMHQNSQNYVEAIKAFRQATYINPSYDKAHNNLGTALMGAGQDSEAMTNLAILSRKSGNIGQAKTLYLRALQVNQASPQTHYNLAMIYEEQGEFGKAIEHFKKFLNLGSGSYPDIARDVEKKIDELSKK